MERHDIRIEQHHGERGQLRGLFELAEDSPAQLDSYLGDGRVLVAIEGDKIVGHLQLIAAGRADHAEIRNMAVRESHQRLGIGRALIAAAVAMARAEGRARLIVATAAADIGNLGFYQHAGFRMSRVERDAFTAAMGYDPPPVIDGIELRDRVWLDLSLGYA